MNLWRYVGLISLSLVLVITALIGWASTWLRLGLDLADINNVSFQSFDIGAKRTELLGLQIGNPVYQTIDAISVDYTLGGIFKGHLDRITFAGVTASFALDDIREGLEDGKKPDGDAEDHSGDLPVAVPAGTFIKELLVENSRIDLKTPGGPIAISLSGQLFANGDQLAFELAANGVGLAGGEGDLQADLAVEGKLNLENGLTLDNMVASGELALLADQAFVPGLVEGLEGGGLIKLALKSGRLKVYTDDLLMTATGSPIEGWSPMMPLSTRLGKTGRPFQLTGRKENGNWLVAIAGSLGVDAMPGAVAANLDLQTTIDQSGQLQSLDQGLVSLEMDQLSWNGSGLQSGKALFSINGPKDALKGRLSLDAEGFSWADDTHTLSDATLKQDLDLAFNGRHLDLTLSQMGRISIDKLTAADQVESGWFTIRLHPDDAPLLSLDIDEGSWQSRLATEIDPVRLEMPSGQWWARIENLKIAASGDFESLKSGQISVKQGRADLPSANLALIGIGSDIEFTQNGLAPDQIIPLSIPTIRPLDEPRWFTPLRLEVTLQPSSEDLSISGRLTSRTQPEARLDFSGIHELKTGNGDVSFELQSLTLGPDALEPGDLSPGLRDVLSDTTGRLALVGQYNWGQNGHESKADLLIEELGLAIGPAKLERVNALFRFDSLTPLTMPAGQDLAIGLLDVGLPLTDGLVAMELKPDGKLDVDQLTWRFAAGNVRARPFTFGSDVQDLTLYLDVDQLDLNALLALTELDGLSGEGKIDGILPLTINETGVIIADGKLEAKGAGVLRYQPDQKQTPDLLQTGSESIGLMLRALENFRYDELKITLDGQTNGDTTIGLHISGANPDLYEGHPIEFNLDLQGDLANLIQTNLSNYQIPDRIREQLQGFGK